MELHTFVGSPNSRKVEAVIDHLGLDVGSCITILPVAPCADQNISRSTRTAWSRRSSMGPSSSGNRTRSCNTSRTRRATMRCSHAILQRRADVVRWQCWELAHFNRAFGTLAFEAVAKPALNLAPADQSLIAARAGGSRAVCAGARRSSCRAPEYGGRRNHDGGLFDDHLRGLSNAGPVRLGALPATSTTTSTACGRAPPGCAPTLPCFALRRRGRHRLLEFQTTLRCRTRTGVVIRALAILLGPDIFAPPNDPATVSRKRRANWLEGAKIACPRGEEFMKTVRLTMAQALVRYLMAQKTEIDGDVGAALPRGLRDLRPRQRHLPVGGAGGGEGRVPDLARAERAVDGARRGRLRQGKAAAADHGGALLDRPGRRQHDRPPPAAPWRTGCRS